MKLLTKLWPVAVCGALLLSGGSAAGPAEEQFHDVPAGDQLEARDAVAAPRVMAYVERTHVPQGYVLHPSYGRAPGSLPDFSSYQDVAVKKTRFFSYLLPLVRAENARLAAVRKRLRYIYDHVRWHRRLDAADQAWLAEVVAEFRMSESDPSRTEFWDEAFFRVDALPEDLVLVQAANESAWGTSRFAREGNNLFGQWCFREGCGIVPAGRPDGATYEVARYDSVTESVGSYMHNLNTGRTYQLLREIRARMRDEGEEPRAADLAAGLVDYSERGLEYVDELRAMIRHNADIIEEIRSRGATDGKS